MARQVLLTLVLLTLGQAHGEAPNSVNISVFKDNSEGSAPRLYRSVPVTVYASASPYGSFPFRLSNIIADPKTSGSHLVPVKEDTVIVRNTNGFLKDSYGNKFVNTPQSLAYKTTIPQQFVKLQDLPAHLSQPLVAASPSFQVKQAVLPYFYGPQYKASSIQSSATAPVYRFGGFSQPLVYAERIKSLAPSSNFHYQGIPTTQHQSSNNKIVYTNSQNYGQLRNEPKFERLERKPANHDKGQLETAQAKHTITLADGNKVVVDIETNPSVPLLDLSLLEPLTFSNPIVPQVQHFLPKINSATYHKLPTVDIAEVKKNNNEFIVQKTKSYDSGIIVGKPKKGNPPTANNPPQEEIDDEDETPSSKPNVLVSSMPTDEFSYEINSPNYKESYNEQVVKYNKETKPEPVEYSYSSKSQEEPVNYSFSHNSNEPAQIKHVSYEGNGKSPKHLIYNFSPQKQNSDTNDSKENKNSKELDNPHHHPHDNDRYTHQHRETLENAHHDRPEHREEEYHHRPNQEIRHEKEHSHRPHQEIRHQKEYHHKPNQEIYDEKEHSHRPHQEIRHQKEYDHKPNQEIYNEKEHSHRPHQEIRHQKEYHNKPNQEIYNEKEHVPRSHADEHHPRTQNVEEYQKSHHAERHERPPNTAHEYLKKDLVNKKEHHHERDEIERDDSPQHQQQYETIKIEPEIVAISPEYDEDITLLPANGSNTHAPIKVDTFAPIERPHPSPLPQHHEFREEYNRESDPSPYTKSQNLAPAHIMQKSKSIIIQEETPDEMHSHREQLMAQMIKHRENSEEDFEKAYKNAAYGFPNYEKQSEEIEKDIYNPETYGAARYTGFEVDHRPFAQYQHENDDLPNKLRNSYKDARDENKDDYYSEYSIHKPESLLDRHKNKVEYYKMYKNNKPEHYFAPDSDENKQQKAKQSAQYNVWSPYTSSTEPEPKQKNYFAQYKAAPVKYEYVYPKAPSRDSFAYASGPLQRFTAGKTHFVEPQFQYGFEPVSIPRLLDSELAAMASNDSPESETPGTRKKVYKENWYIKKTRTSGANPSS